jgi:DNA-binding NtrC family response regulator
MSPQGTILIVEDDADVLKAATIALQPHVGHLQCHSSVAELESALSGATFEAVLLDMNFAAGARNGAAGLDALARIQQRDATLAVVLMTAYGGVALAVEALKRGAVDFVLKPWRNDALVAAVTSAMTVTRARRHAEACSNLGSLERDAIAKALTRHGGNISLTASALGLSRAALYRRILKHGL